MTPRVPPRLDYVRVITRFGEQWAKAGHPRPAGHANPTGRPLDEEGRQYQRQRGDGHGRAISDEGELAPRSTGKPDAAQQTVNPVEQPVPQSQPSLVLSKANGAGARRAEPGDSAKVTNDDVTFVKLVDRLTLQGRRLTAGQTRHWERLEGGAQGPDRAWELVIFWRADATAGPEACLSNHFLAVFVDDQLLDGTFHSVQQYAEYVKAVMAGDARTANRIRQTTEASESTTLGRRVQGYDHLAWMAVAADVVERGIFLKFNQNTQLRDYLLGTGNAELVEASPGKNWGIGVTEDDLPSTPRS